jgi:hypothetical protein
MSVFLLDILLYLLWKLSMEQDFATSGNRLKGNVNFEKIKDPCLAFRQPRRNLCNASSSLLV